MTHESHIRDLTGPLHSHISATYGIVEESILNSCRYFHVVDGLVPDIMHDILEGTLQLTLRHLISYFIRDMKYFTLKDLNKRISSFNYGYADSRNKPSEISKNTFSSSDTLKQSGKHHRIIR